MGFDANACVHANIFGESIPGEPGMKGGLEPETEKMLREREAEIALRLAPDFLQKPHAAPAEAGRRVAAKYPQYFASSEMVTPSLLENVTRVVTSGAVLCNDGPIFKTEYGPLNNT